MKEMMTRAEWYSDYMEYRQVYGRKKPANDFVKYFLNWCSREHPETDVLTQSMIDVWCKQRECESNRSFVTRVSAINVFLKYINERSSSQFNLVDNDLELEPLQEPTLFSKEELANFFRATDEINAHEDCRIPLPRFQAKLKALIVPVIFRLMYSTGLRPNEVRWLDCADVDFENGIIHVRKAKGYYQRIIALHPSMVSMLKRYNELMEKEMPGRKVFFPNTHDEYRDIFFITTQFKRCWYKYNQHGDREVISYSLRHNYAVENIMSWPQDGYNLDQKMLVLSKSMGHQRLSSTLYYFHLVPRFADMLERYEGEYLNEIIPEID